MKVTFVQSRGILQDPTVNFFKARMRINNIDSDIFVFPEMFCSGYSGDEHMMRIDDLDEKIIKKLGNLSRMRGSAVICGCPIKFQGDIYDAVAVIDNDKVEYYKKMKLTSEGAFDETKVFKPGNQPMIVDHMGIKIGIAIGDDLLMHGLFKYYADNGADLIICVSAYDDKQMDKFDKIVVCRAAENNIPVILCNMVGPDCGVKLAGRSKYIDAEGNIVENCTDSSDVRTVEFDEEAIKDHRGKRKPVADIEFGECIKCETHSGEGEDPNPDCMFAGM